MKNPYEFGDENKVIEVTSMEEAKERFGKEDPNVPVTETQPTIARSEGKSQAVKATPKDELLPLGGFLYKVHARGSGTLVLKLVRTMKSEEKMFVGMPLKTSSEVVIIKDGVKTILKVVNCKNGLYKLKEKNPKAR